MIAAELDARARDSRLVKLVLTGDAAEVIAVLAQVAH